VRRTADRACEKRAGWAQRRYRVLPCALIVLSVVPASAYAQAPRPARTLPAEALRARIEGVWALEEFHRAGQVLRPPDVEGRFVLRGGVAAFIVHDRVQRENPTARGGYGRYVVERGQLRYGYEEFTTLNEAGSVITAPEGGLDTYAPRVAGDTLRLRTADGVHEFLFTPERQVYSERGQIVRVWRRVGKP
jgi:hypothetical protein